MLIVLALASSGSILELAGTGFIRHGGSFSQRLTEAPPTTEPLPKPCYQNLATQTHNLELTRRLLEVESKLKGNLGAVLHALQLMLWIF